ncbi:hypothetical protein JW933_01240 [candidate division FCPU426 bacterium]|nr:hypothetical protein [candidate division FCPU426 bacterium]
MALLSRLLLLLIFYFLGSPPVCAQERPLLDYTFSGFVQGRATALPAAKEPAPGILRSGSGSNQAAGTKKNQVAIHQLDFSLATTLPGGPFQLKSSATVTAGKVMIKDAYLAYIPFPGMTWRAGQFRIPFGHELQISSRDLDTPERSLLYGFGNFGWVEDMGFALLQERSYGLCLDMEWEPVFASMAPFLSLACVAGNSKNTQPDLPAQAVARIGVGSSLHLEELMHDLALGVSCAYGRQKYSPRQWEYMPIGSTGNLASNPGARMVTEAWEQYETAAVFGADAMLRLNEVTVKTEWASRSLSRGRASGYYITGIFDLSAYVLEGMAAVLRWEEASGTYSDGAHRPGQFYQAATAGLKWNLSGFWTLRLDYIALYLDRIPHAFNGSDIVSAQVQFTF